MSKPGDGKATDGSTNSLIAHSFTARRDENFFATSQEELVLASEVSPPYHPTANLRLPIHPSPDHALSHYASSPPYKSSSGVNLFEEPLMKEKTDYRRLTPGKEKTFGEDKKPKPSVHYPHDIKPPSRKQDSYDPYVTPSIAGTDDDDSGEYDWSGEEDLVGEEAKFEKKMGIKSKPQGWSFVRYTTIICPLTR
jgi:hypothetical protein